jgi:hypothetical protein
VWFGLEEEIPMGREANCHCQWASESADCKVLLETHDLIVRGPSGSIRRSVPIASLTEIEVHDNQLLFRVGEDHVALALGLEKAQRWARALTAPPPTLAMKLGISTASHLALIGELDTEELQTAIAEAASTDGNDANLILAKVRTSVDLNHALDAYSAYASDPPIWIIYAKGSGKPLTESDIRNTMRREGLIDTKVASVSTILTALRFIKRG